MKASDATHQRTEERTCRSSVVAARAMRSGGGRLLSVLAAVLLLGASAAGCSSDEGEEVTSAGSAANSDDESTSTSASADADSGEEDDEPDGSDGSDATTPGGEADGTVPDADLPGEAFEGFATDGAEMIVVGVAFDDTLNMREGPGTDFDVVAELDPVGETVVTTGRARLLSRSIWYEVSADGATGWVNSSFLAFEGLVDDVTSAVIDDLGERPVAETMLDLGRVVAESQASEDPRSRVVEVVAPEVGDLGEVTFDVIGLGDDAVFGLRLHVFGQPTEDGEGFSLKSVEQTTLCGRGVTGGGLCP